MERALADGGVDLDILYIGAHPDDEAWTLAAFGQWNEYEDQRAGVITITRGEGGGNAVGLEEGPALGLIREGEERTAVGFAGIEHVFNLDAVDFFYTLSAPLSHEVWGGRDVLSRVIRVVRATRPDVIVTMNPSAVQGNHGNHQQAAMFAVEAYLLAGREDVFPEHFDEGLKPFAPTRSLRSGSDGQAPTGPDAVATGFTPLVASDVVFGAWNGTESEKHGKRWSAVRDDSIHAYRTQGWHVFPPTTTDPEKIPAAWFTLIDSRTPFPDPTSGDTAALGGASLPVEGGSPLGTTLERAASSSPCRPAALSRSRWRSAPRAPPCPACRSSSRFRTDGTPGAGRSSARSPRSSPAPRPSPSRCRSARPPASTCRCAPASPPARAAARTCSRAHRRRGRGRDRRPRRDRRLPRVDRGARHAPPRRARAHPALAGSGPRRGVRDRGAQPLRAGAGRRGHPHPARRLHGRAGPGAGGGRARARRVDGHGADREHRPLAPTANRAPDGGVYAVTVTASAGGVAAATAQGLHLVPRLVASRTEGVEVDAVRGTGEYPGEPIDIGTLWEGSAVTAEDASGSTWVTYDDAALHVFVQVIDDVLGTLPPPEDNKRRFRTDSVEIMIDPRGTSDHTATTFILGAPPGTDDGAGGVGGPVAGRDHDNRQGPIEEVAPSVRIAAEISEPYQGYVLETTIPFAEAPDGIDPTRMGFNVVVYDSDTQDRTGQSRIGWSTFPGVQADPFRWGVLEPPDLEAQPSAPVEARIPNTSARSVASPQSILQSAADGVGLGGFPSLGADAVRVDKATRRRREISAVVRTAAPGTRRVFVWDGERTVGELEATDVRSAREVVTIPLVGDVPADATLTVAVSLENEDGAGAGAATVR
ncbi:sugar-binding protein [Brachybacterium sp. GPGPB12]|uniref:sugar-binding protein n=1 Tax=Brachybacterium sp. GPGPB12 TaxID=3023517 RepID=UPI0031343C4C